jgi:type IV secretory pathway VirD2 relaxase
MSTKKIKKVNFTKKVNNVVETAKTSVKTANDYALNTTEDLVTETITIASQWQNVTSKALKGSVKLLENQQNLVFDALETYKNHFVKGKKRFTQIFA